MFPLSLILKNRKRISWALAIFIVMAIIIILLNRINSQAAITTGFGFIFGYIFQRSRFCFASAFRDIFMIRNASLSRAVLSCVFLTTSGFACVHFLRGNVLPVSGIIYPLGINIMVGGFIFGFGMAFAGNCISGCLTRMGEGHLLQWITFGGIFLGVALGAWHFSLWDQNFGLFMPMQFLPDILGWPIAIISQFCVIVLLFIVTLLYERNWDLKDYMTDNIVKISLPDLKNIAGNIFSNRPISYQTGAALLAITNSLLLYFWGKPWAITGGITHLSGWFLIKLGIPAADWPYFQLGNASEGNHIFVNHPLLYLALAMVVGSFFSSFIAGEFRLNCPKSMITITMGFIGGLMLGYGASIALGCNIGGFLSGVSSFLLHGWVLGLFMLIGSYFGGKLILRCLVQ